MDSIIKALKNERKNKPYFVEFPVILPVVKIIVSPEVRNCRKVADRFKEWFVRLFWLDGVSRGHG